MKNLVGVLLYMKILMPLTFSLRYSSMLAENLVNTPSLCKPSYLCSTEVKPSISGNIGDETDPKAESDNGTG